jgi:transcriptional regulator with XRE-family HTH domain
LICGNYVVVAISNIGFAYADEKPLDRATTLVRRTGQVGRIVDIQTAFFTFDSCKMVGDRVTLPVSFISSHMIKISLGQRIHELRDKAGLSLRKLADQIGISSPFLSDIELGRRFPSEEILAKLAKALDVSPDELKQYDTRGPIADLKRLVDSDPKLGFAFRTVVEKIKNGELTAEDIIAKLSKRKSRA